MKLITENNHGVFHREIVKGKPRDTLAWETCSIVTDAGTVITDDVTPKFSGWTYFDYLDQLKTDRSVLYVEPMSAHEDSQYLSANPLHEHEIAELKMDGHRGTVHIGKESNRVFSRRISKKTDWYNENSDQVPHIRDLALEEFAGTVLDGEFDYGTTSMGVQSVMGSLPANAIQYQFEHGFIPFFGFDILYYKGVNVQKMPLWKRKIYLYQVLNAFWRKYGECNMEFANIYVHEKAQLQLMTMWHDYLGEDPLTLLPKLDRHVYLVPDYRTKFEEVIAQELEGLMVKDIDSPYEQKKTRNMLKLKGKSTWDCVILGLTEPTQDYEGKEIEKWKYWQCLDGSLIELSGNQEAYEYAIATGKAVSPVSKPYFMGWCGGIEFGVWKDGKLIRVGDCKGLTESVMMDLKENADKYVKEKRVLEVEANGIIDKAKGSLRHPRFKGWRDDKDHAVCTFKDHIREL